MVVQAIVLPSESSRLNKNCITAGVTSEGRVHLSINNHKAVRSSAVSGRSIPGSCAHFSARVLSTFSAFRLRRSETEKTTMRVEIDLNENEECYVTINGQQIPCSREVYLTIKRPGRKEAMRKYRDGKRPFINGKRCTADCEYCSEYENGICCHGGNVSLDAMYEDGEYEPEDNKQHDIISEMNAEYITDLMRRELEGESDRCKEIFALMLQEKQDRVIAEELQIADGTVTYYIKKIRTKLEKFKQYLQ